MSNISSILPIVTVLTQCPTGYTPLSTGVQCYSDQYCQSIAAGYTCEGNQCCTRVQRDFCTANQVYIDGGCYPLVNINEPCAFSQQCMNQGCQCLQGFCRRADEVQGSCVNPNDVLERNLTTGVLKNCLEERCSEGFTCEYTTAGRYQCCGLYNRNVDYNYGTVRMYPGTNLPLVCKAINSCLFVDTPNCVYSARYGCNVCCSTWNC